MISENISHDSFVEIGGQYDNLPGFEYSNIEYDIYKNETVPGTKRKIKKKIAVQVCRYAQLPGGKKSILPSILMELLAARKNARKKLEEETDQFKKNLWNGLQLAYKVTANSLYGQCGAKTSPINKVEIAASTTAVGRRMITFSKKYIEKAYKDKIVTLDLKHSGTFDTVTKQMIPSKYTGMTVHVKDSYCVYGDTDSVFIRFNVYNLEGVKYSGLEAVSLTIALCKKASEEISSQLKRPQNIEFEKAIYPFILISKKRYHGHYYTKIDSPSFYPNSMGIALKRRDNAPIVKHIFGGGIDIIMNEHNVEKGLSFVKNECQKLLRGEFPLTEFIISKTLKSYYKKPRQIAHNVLACRQAQRDPGNRFEPNDRVPYAFVVNSNASALQGDKIETPEFIKQNKLLLDYKMYITNQIMKPVAQIFELVPGYEKTEEIFKLMIDRYENERTGNISLDRFIKKRTTNITSLSDLINQAKQHRQEQREIIEITDADEDDIDNDIDEDIMSDHEGDTGEIAELSNYDDPNF
jgi:DNA polymerase delta subunit 1